MALKRTLFRSLAVVILSASVAHADPAAFDLIGPKVDVRVQRDGKTLPIAQVPNLKGGDRLWLHPDFPDTQSAHYLMIVAFLRGATNPPPESWFTKVETWNKQVHDEGLYVVVPDEAQQALIFLAPETGGAFSTLMKAVRGRPGAFVRASQDLEQAGLDRQRLDKYLSIVRTMNTEDSNAVKEESAMLARSLSIKVDSQCFDKPTAQQVPCLTQNTDQMVLDDAHGQTMVDRLTTGASADLMAQLTYTPTAGAGYFSPYVGAVVDVVRILGSTHTAQYQYIPALALPKSDTLNLRLNNPPSFRNPKSVIVIGLPPVSPTPVPPLRIAEENQAYCAEKPFLVLPIEGAPLAYATELAHNFVLHVDTKKGNGVDLPATPDAGKGGFVIDTAKVDPNELKTEANARLKGRWGFDGFDGPAFKLHNAQPASWTIASKDASALIVGRADTLHLQTENAACVEEVTIHDAEAKKLETTWKVAKSDEVEVHVALENAKPGPATMLVKQYGLGAPDAVPLHTYSEAGHLNSFSIHAGDAVGELRGTRLDEVASLELNGSTFTPGDLSRADQQDILQMNAKNANAGAALEAGHQVQAKVSLKDGRTLNVQTNVEPSRPKLSMISKSIQPGQSQTPNLSIRLGSDDELPQDGKLTFFLKTQYPANFPPNEKIEVATADGSFHVTLSEMDGNLTPQDSKIVMAVLDPMKHLGPSAFGPLKFRPIDANGAPGDWQPLVSLVRVPALTGVKCVNVPEKQCMLSGSNLFLLESVSADPSFANGVTVPEGFVSATLNVPQPVNKTLYFKLRDDPSAVDSAVLPVSMPFSERAQARAAEKAAEKAAADKNAKTSDTGDGVVGDKPAEPAPATPGTTAPAPSPASPAPGQAAPQPNGQPAPQNPPQPKQ
jgi:hypothetical protein